MTAVAPKGRNARSSKGEEVSSPTHSRLPLRRLVFSLIPLLILLVLGEGIAWLIDSHTDFRGKLLAALRMMEIDNQPIQAAESLPWPDGVLGVRPAENDKRAPQTYSIGGRNIADANPTTDRIWLRPQTTVSVEEKRIFIVGGSAAYGFPYDYQDTFAGFLDEKLRGQGWRIINASQVGAASGDLVPVVNRIVEHYQPSVVILMVGNNEWVRWVPAGQPWISQRRVRLLRLLAHSRAAAGVEYLSFGHSAQVGRQPGGQTTFAMHQELTGSAYAIAHPLDTAKFDPQQWPMIKQGYLDVFQSHLHRMIGLAQERQVRVLILGVPFNYKLSPAWKHPQPEWFDPDHRQLLRSAIRDTNRLYREGNYGDALSRAETGLEFDSLPPVLHYLRGQCLEALNRHREAEQAYAQSREQMIGNLGSRLSMNLRIAESARATECERIDLPLLFEQDQHARGRYYNDDLIHDDCHPSPQGHRLIAKAIEQWLTTQQSVAAGEHE